MGTNGHLLTTCGAPSGRLLLMIVSRIRKNFSANIDRTCQANERGVLRSFGLEWIFIGRLPFVEPSPWKACATEVFQPVKMRI
jgi:hypothetical protein